MVQVKPIVPAARFPSIARTSPMSGEHVYPSVHPFPAALLGAYFAPGHSTRQHPMAGRRTSNGEVASLAVVAPRDL